MKYLRSQVIWQTVLLLIVLITLYYIAPLLQLEQEDIHSLLLFVAIAGGAAILVLWLRRHLAEQRFATELKRQAQQQAARAGADSMHDLQMLRQDFEQAFAELARKVPGRGIFRTGGSSDMPWIVILGPPGAGKSTALERSNLTFTPLGRHVQGIAGTRNCRWWLTEEAIFLDTAGRYAVQEQDHDEWLDFLRLLGRRRRKRPLDAVLLQVSIDELIKMSESMRLETVTLLRQRLDELTDQLHVRLPVYLIFNKCDYFEGFAEFFQGLSPIERRQPLGFGLERPDAIEQPLVATFRERYDALVASIGWRTTMRMTQIASVDAAIEGESRAKVLAFPAELAQHRDTLCEFVEKLAYPSRHRESPWLVAVHFTTAAQSGEVVPSWRQRLFREIGLEIPKRQMLMSPPSTQYFLNGLFERIVRQAQETAQPTQKQYRLARIYQAVGAAIAMLACGLGVHHLGSLYYSERGWLGNAVTAAKNYADEEPTKQEIQRISRNSLQLELEGMERMLGLVTIERPDPSALIRPAHRAAVNSLRWRIDQVLLRPLRPPLERWLIDAAHWTEGEPPQVFADGFAALKLAHLLERRGCNGADARETREWTVEQIYGLWRSKSMPQVQKVLSVKNREDAERLLQILDYYFRTADLTPAHSGSPDLRPKVSALSFEVDLVEQAHKALSSPRRSEEIEFLLRAMNVNLLSRRAQLSKDILVDGGIEEVFTPNGCNSFFAKSARKGEVWWRCVLDFTSPGSSNLDDVYRKHYSAAWKNWLQSIEIKLEVDPTKAAGPPEDVVAKAQKLYNGLAGPASQSLEHLLVVLNKGINEEPSARSRRTAPSIETKQPRLKQLMGCAQQAKNVAAGVAQIREQLPEQPQCRNVRDDLGVIGQVLTADDKKHDELVNEPIWAQALRDSFREYRDQIIAVEKHLRRGGATPEEALKIVSAVYNKQGEFYELEQTRVRFVENLDIAAKEAQVDITRLSQLLEMQERALWKALADIGRKQLQALWQKDILLPWAPIRPRPGQDPNDDPSRCGKVVELWNSKVLPFIQKNLDPLANSYMTCDMKALKEPFAAPIRLSTQACKDLHKAQELILQTDCPKPGDGGGGGGGGGGPTPESVFQPANRDTACNWVVQNVKIDTGTEVWECSGSSGLCFPKKKGEDVSSGRGVLRVQWKGPNSTFDEQESADTLVALLRKAHQAGRAYIFDLRHNPGNCAGVQLTVNMSASGGGPVSHTQWHSIDLPKSIIDGS